MGIYVDTVFSLLAERMERPEGRVQKKSQPMCQTFTRDALNTKDEGCFDRITGTIILVEPAMFVSSRLNPAGRSRCFS